MPRKKASAVSKTAKKSTKAAAKNSYQQQVDKFYQGLIAQIKKSVDANNKESKKLKSSQSKLHKELKGNEKALAAVEKRNKNKTTATAKSQISKAQKSCKKTEKAIAQKQDALLATAAQAQELKQTLAKIAAEQQFLANYRKEQDSFTSVAAETKSKKEKNKTKASKAKKDSKQDRVVEVFDFANEEDSENQLALVIEDDFMGDDEEDMEKGHI